MDKKCLMGRFYDRWNPETVEAKAVMKRLASGDYEYLGGGLLRRKGRHGVEV